MHLRPSRNDVAQQGLRPLDVDGKIIVDEENRHLPLLGAGACLQQQQFVHHAFIGAEANRVAEKSGDGTELATVWATSPGFDGDNTKRSPAFSDRKSTRLNSSHLGISY